MVQSGGLAGLDGSEDIERTLPERGVEGCEADALRGEM